jgi:hypothetical protein
VSNPRFERNHWAVCSKDGSILYDEYGRAEIWESRALATSRSVSSGCHSHVELVAIDSPVVLDK